MYDVIVVGAGPAGCTASKVLAENGYKVLLVENGEKNNSYSCVLTKKSIEFVKSYFGEHVLREITSDSEESRGMVFTDNRGKEHRFEQEGLKVGRFSLIQRLKKKAAESGVEIRNGVLAWLCWERDGFVEVSLSGEKYTENARYVLNCEDTGGGWKWSITMMPIIRIKTFQTFNKGSIDLDPHYFYVYLQPKLSEYYAWFKMEGDNLVLGVAVREDAEYKDKLSHYYEQFIAYMEKNHCLKVSRQMKSEEWQLAHGCHVDYGVGRILFAGEAAGFLNPMNEGISTGMESGYCAASAIMKHFDNPEAVHEAYRQNTESLKSYMQHQWSLVGGMASTFRKIEYNNEYERRCTKANDLWKQYLSIRNQLNEWKQEKVDVNKEIEECEQRIKEINDIQKKNACLNACLAAAFRQIQQEHALIVGLKWQIEDARKELFRSGFFAIAQKKEICNRIAEMRNELRERRKQLAKSEDEYEKMKKENSSIQSAEILQQEEQAIRNNLRLLKKKKEIENIRMELGNPIYLVTLLSTMDKELLMEVLQDDFFLGKVISDKRLSAAARDSAFYGSLPEQIQEKIQKKIGGSDLEIIYFQASQALGNPSSKADILWAKERKESTIMAERKNITVFVTFDWRVARPITIPYDIDEVQLKAHLEDLGLISSHWISYLATKVYLDTENGEVEICKDECRSLEDLGIKEFGHIIIVPEEPEKRSLYKILGPLRPLYGCPMAQSVEEAMNQAERYSDDDSRVTTGFIGAV